MNDYIKPKVIPAQKPSFWALHFAGWAGYWVLFILENLVLGVNKMGVNAYIIIPLFFSACAGALLTLPLRYIYQRCWQYGPKRLLIIVVLACFVVASAWTPSKNVILWSWTHEYSQSADLAKTYYQDLYFLDYFNSMIYSLAMVLAWSTLYFSINFYYRLMNEKEMHLAAQRLSHNAQIKMLRYQINPHFLFNTLNAISTLVMMDKKEKANGMLVRLSTFLRFSLDNDPEKKITLHEELKALMLYLEIEKTRFDDRLSVYFEIQPETETLMVPSLLLQPLIENSIKYAIAKLAKNGEIKVRARIEADSLVLEVCDNGPDAQELLEQNKQHKNDERGVGIRNIQERLDVLYPQQHAFLMRHNDPQGLKVLIKIPIEHH
ncbi:sensor histidine kinase [Ningiella sp. W23]|uniref:sensor histidine kinase n=1 Tax=Ningiella sp. W23 TaxID=3023715 RepID=UPI00375700EE